MLLQVFEFLSTSPLQRQWAVGVEGAEGGGLVQGCQSSSSRWGGPVWGPLDMASSVEWFFL